MSESCFQNTMDSVLNLFLKELRFDLKKKTVSMKYFWKGIVWKF